MESLGNIRRVCSEHASKPEPFWSTMPPEFFVGKYVKVAFKSDHLDFAELEHMWVEVMSVSGDKLVGKLDNDPITCNLNCGDTVEVTLAQIESVIADDEFLIPEASTVTE